MKVGVARYGGLLGNIPMRATVDTTELDAGIAAAAEQSVRQLPFGRAPSPPRHPDQFRFEISLEDEGGRRSVVISEDEIPLGLRPLLDEAIRMGRPGGKIG